MNDKESMIKLVLQTLAEHFGFELACIGKKTLIWGFISPQTSNFIFDTRLEEYLAYPSLSSLLFNVLNCEVFKWKKSAHLANQPCHPEDYLSLKNDFFGKGYDLNKLMMTLNLCGEGLSS